MDKIMEGIDMEKIMQKITEKIDREKIDIEKIKDTEKIKKEIRAADVRLIVDARPGQGTRSEREAKDQERPGREGGYLRKPFIWVFALFYKVIGRLEHIDGAGGDDAFRTG